MNPTLTVICGGMYAGKSSELIRQLERYSRAGIQVQAFMPRADTRYKEQQRIITHDQRHFQAHSISAPMLIQPLLREETKIVGVDEIQFFDDTLVPVVRVLLRAGLSVIAAGLDLDYREQPFQGMAQLLCLATGIHKLRAVCARCGADACRSCRTQGGDKRLQVGGEESYQAVCLSCYQAGSDHGIAAC